MDDLVEHFSGLGPEDLHPRQVSPPPRRAATPQSPPLDDILPPHTADLPATTTITSTSTITTHHMAKASKTHANPPHRHATQTWPPGHHPARTIGGDGTMDLQSFADLPLQRHATYSSSSFTDTTANSGLEDDDDGEAHYIHHFTGKIVSSPQVTPRPHQRRNRFTDLAGTNGDSGHSHDSSSAAIDGCTYSGGANGYHGTSETHDRSINTEDFDSHDRRSQDYSESEGSYPLVVQRAHSSIPLSHGVGPAGGIAHRLRTLHQQDMARDELLIVRVSDLKYSKTTKACLGPPSRIAGSS